MGRIEDFHKQNPGWTLKVRACGHYEPETLPNAVQYQYPQYTTGGNIVSSPAPSFCKNCQNKTATLQLEYNYWAERWRLFKEEVENG